MTWLTNLILRFGALKRHPRTGWLSRGISRAAVESVADHVSRTAFIAMLLVDTLPRRLKVDANKVFRIALFHDLVESVIKDIDKEAWGYISPDGRAKREIELNIMKKLLGDIPNGLRDYYLKIWLEYRDKDKRSLEARIVEAADKLELLFQAFEYMQTGAPFRMVREMVEDAEKNLERLRLPNALSVCKELTARMDALKEWRK